MENRPLRPSHRWHRRRAEPTHRGGQTDTTRAQPTRGGNLGRAPQHRGTSSPGARPAATGACRPPPRVGPLGRPGLPARAELGLLVRAAHAAVGADAEAGAPGAAGADAGGRGAGFGGAPARHRGRAGRGAPRQRPAGPLPHPRAARPRAGAAAGRETPVESRQRAIADPAEPRPRAVALGWRGHRGLSHAPAVLSDESPSRLRVQQGEQDTTACAGAAYARVRCAASSGAKGKG